MTRPPTSPASAPVPAVPELMAERVSKSFGDHLVLRGLDFTVRRGQILGIVGGSGSGKTVLLQMLAGLQTPSEGCVRVADHSQAEAPLVDMATLDEDQREAVRMYWAFVFQRNALFSGTVLDNISLLLTEHTSMTQDEIRTRARKSLAAAALDVDHVIDMDRDNLSGGMAKRVAIARAIAIDPALIFYDEPTTGLDPVVGAQIHELIWNTHHTPTATGLPRTSVVVTHDKDLLRRVHPDIIMLHNAEICFSGNYPDFAQVTNGPPHEYLQAMPVLHTRTPTR